MSLGVTQSILLLCRRCDWLEVRFHIAQPIDQKQMTGLQGNRGLKARLDPTWLPLTHHWASPFKLSPER